MMGEEKVTLSGRLSSSSATLPQNSKFGKVSFVLLLELTRVYKLCPKSERRNVEAGGTGSLGLS